mmetsp:Transcript_24093/g.35707  ORF Transcript_24093/g.35707 Transcript_24093/m.35707 type:complete len:215 (+) Transcript_24093:92-736(+)
MPSSNHHRAGIRKDPVYNLHLPISILYTSVSLILFLLCGCIAYFQIVNGNKKGDDKIYLISQFDLGYLYLTAFLLKLGGYTIGMNLIERRVAANIFAPDQYIYEVKGVEGEKLGYVLFVAEGALGRFNRAQRAYQNYNDNLPINIMYILLVGFVYPREVMMISILYIGLRILYSMEYTRKPGARFPWYILSQMTMMVAETLVIMIAHRSFNITG